MFCHLFSTICITLIISSCSSTYSMARLRSTWQATTRTQKPTGVRQYTIPTPRPPVINSQSIRERFNTFSTNMVERVKNFFWRSKMNARILTHGITESDVIYKIKNNPAESFDTFLNYLKDIDQEKANAFLDQIMLSNPEDNEIGFLSTIIDNQVWNKKRNHDALKKLSEWMSLKLMVLIKIPNTEDMITDMIIFLMGLDQQQKIGKQIVLNLSNICQSSTGRYLIKEISIFGTVLQEKKFRKYQQEVGSKIFIIWSNIVNALKADKETLSLLEKTNFGKQILEEIKKYDDIQREKEIAEMSRTIIE